MIFKHSLVQKNTLIKNLKNFVNKNENKNLFNINTHRLIIKSKM